MQKSESEAVKPEPAPVVVSQPVVAPTPVVTPAAPQSDMGAFLSSRQNAAPAQSVAEPIVEVEPVVEEKPQDTDSAVANMRKELADAFQLDADAMAAGFDTLDEQLPEEENLEATAMFNMPEGEGTLVFNAVGSSQSNEAVDGNTTVMDNFNDFLVYEEDDDEEEIIDEYNSIEDAQSVVDDLVARKRKLGIRFGLTSVIALMLIIITVGGNIFPFGHASYFIAMTVLIVAAALLNLSNFQSVASIFSLKPDVDFAPTLALIASLIQVGVAAFFGTKGIASSGMLAAAAVTSLAFNVLSKRITVSRTLANFELIANEEPKQAGAFIPYPASATILDPKKHGESLIFGRRTTIDMQGFIAHSLSPDLYEKVSGKVSLVVVIAAFVALIVAFIKGGSAAVAVSAFAGVCCLGAQIAVSYPSAVLLNRVCKKLRGKQVMLSGFKAAEAVSEANVVVLDSDEIFNDECVSLFKFRTFGSLSPDVAFMTAAALTNEGHSPLAGMFNQIAATTGAGMLAADSVIYENSMGLTGWVDEKKTLLGNRMIMESHSIPVPSMEIDRKILKSGKFPLYLAIDDKIAAMFIIGYSADRHMLHRLRRLHNTGANLLIRTVDPNVTADLVCSVYGLPTGSVEVMTSDASRYYCDRMAPSENEPAILCAENARGFVDANVASYSLNRSARAASIAVIVLTCLVMALAISLPAFEIISAISMMTVLVSYVLVTAVTGVVGLICS